MHRITYRDVILGACIVALVVGPELPIDMPHGPERVPAPGPAAPAVEQVSSASSSADFGRPSGHAGALPITLS